jgi:hypothetical protein
MPDAFAEFLARLATDEDYLHRYRTEREAVLSEAGLTDDIKAALQSREAALIADPLPSNMHSGFEPDIQDPGSRSPWLR